MPAHILNMGGQWPVHNSNFDFYAYIYSEQTKVFQHHKTHVY